jgi:hypothetical protein
MVTYSIVQLLGLIALNKLKEIYWELPLMIYTIDNPLNLVKLHIYIFPTALLS